MNLKKLLGEVIGMRQNDLLISKHYFEEAGEEWNYEEIDFAFDKLQTALTRLLIGHNYCTNPECSCSAENHLKRVVDRYNNILRKHLYENQYGYLVKEVLGEELE